MYKERNKTSDAGGGTRFFRQVAFVMLFLMLAGSLAGIGSLLFKNTSVLDEAGRGTVDVEVATIYGAGTSDNPFLIGTKADLEAMRNAVNTASGTLTGQTGGGSLGGGTATAATAHYKLTADIDFGEGNTTNWTPIGNSSYPFKGVFDGDRHVVKNLYINTSSAEQGFFGRAAGVTIKNLGMVDVNLSSTAANSYIGGIIGYLTGTLVMSDCFVSGIVAGQTDGTGGLIGFLANGIGSVKIHKSFNAAAVSQRNGSNSMGGLLGYCHSNANMVITECFNAGSVTTPTTSGGVGYDIGGICSTAMGSITNTYNVGTIKGGGTAGGLHSENQAMSVKNAYNAGNVSGSGAGNYGLVYNTSGGVTYSYNNQEKVLNAGGGTNLTTAQMTSDDVLTGSMANLVTSDGAGKWVKRPNDTTSETDLSKRYYPELASMANHEWKVFRDYSKASVVASGFVDPGYKPNEKPICNSNTTVEVPSIGNGT